jgi:hypothetical protein
MVDMLIRSAGKLSGSDLVWENWWFHGEFGG